MKIRERFFVLTVIIFSFVVPALAQSKLDVARMERDIEVAENILSTLIKQQFEKRSFFPMEVSGEYREGYGVTFRLPNQVNGPMIWNIGGQTPGVAVLDGDTYTYSFNFPSGEQAELERVMGEDNRVKTETVRGTGRMRTTSSRKVNVDSIREVSADKIIAACKEFLANYGDLITQLPANEKIVITNRSDGDRIWYGAFANTSKPSYISLEVIKADIASYKQGKLSKDQFDKKIKIVNSVIDDELQPDLELLTSIFNRLYRADLSRTFFTEENIYYERMKDYGAIYYMQVYSSNQSEFSNRRYIMPTVGLEDLDQAARDKKVTELYPQFEKDIKADILEYGRTVKSLNSEESLIFDIRLTKCDGCGIPSSLEISVKASVLNDYSSGKLSKDAALAKMNIKKGSAQ